MKATELFDAGADELFVFLRLDVCTLEKENKCLKAKFCWTKTSRRRPPCSHGTKTFDPKGGRSVLDGPERGAFATAAVLKPGLINPPGSTLIGGIDLTGNDANAHLDASQAPGASVCSSLRKQGGIVVVVSPSVRFIFI